MIIDTHSHIYLSQFANDRESVLADAINNGIGKILLPNIDSSTVEAMLAVSGAYPGKIFPMIGLHPGSVRENFQNELTTMEEWLYKEKFCAVGEIGLDLYWDENKKFIEEQKLAFRYQLRLAKKMFLPVVIHIRESFEQTFEVLEEENDDSLKGVFHCFSGNMDQAQKAIDMGFLLGIGGVVTYKKSGLAEVVEKIDTKHLLLETDSPFLPPVPFRGNRNDTIYIKYVAQKIAELHSKSIEDIARITTANAEKLFKL